MAYLGRFDGSEAKHASPAMAAVAGVGGAGADVCSLPTSTKWSVLSSRVEGLVAELGQVIGRQDAYCIEQSTGEGPAMKAVREKMTATPWAKEWLEKRTMFSYGEEMSTDPLEALFLKQLVHLAQARKVLEVGMFVGYGSVAMLESVPHVEVVSLEIDPYLKGWLSSCLAGFPGIAGRHRVVIGPALKSLPTLQGERFDLVFVDANKAEYLRYVELILEHDLLAPTGTIVADNVLYNGYPYVPSHFDAQPQRRGFGDAICEFNRWVSSHPLLEQVVLPIRDGVSLIRRRDVAQTPPRPLAAPANQVQLRHRSGATCSVSVYGAHVLSWCLPDAGEQLFVSSRAVLDTPGTAIRGGIPICWPQFGTFQTAKAAPGLKHGLARQSGLWQVCEASEDAASFRLRPDEDMLRRWSGEFDFVYTVSLRARSLCLQLEVTNTGSEALEFTGCLHTYFRCEECKNCAVQGLKGERVDVGVSSSFRGEQLEEREEVTFDGKKEEQLLYGSAADSLIIKDGSRQRLRLLKSNMPDWVIWNIGDDKRSTLEDLGEGEQHQYVCVEPAFASQPVRVAPGATWCGMHEAKAL
mmetsp:Transcript_25851/g.60192  ORF Transcript_25851/g.60192 Transcript_25851/m.60192 type:complete len:580 (+) Transcript_25851:56-1795(+)